MPQPVISLEALAATGRQRVRPPIPKGASILLLLPPFYTPYTPPLGLGVLKAFLVQQGYRVTCFDFNTVSEIWVTHHRYFELLQGLDGLTPQHGYTNLWYILQAHMLAHVNGRGDADCARVLARVLTVYDLSPDTAIINGLVATVRELFDRIEHVITRTLDLHATQVVGTSTYSTSLAPSLFILKRVKDMRPDAVTVMGGGVFADDLATGSDNLSTLIDGFPFVDHIVMGEGEVLFSDLLEGYQAQRLIARGPDTPTLDVKSISAPDYTDFDIANYLHLCIEGARSCPFQCHFCSETVQWGGYRKKPPAMLADQMITLADRYGNRTFFMGDSLMNPYIEDLSKALLERDRSILYDGYLRADKLAADPRRVERWARSGCVRTRLGVESGSARILEAMQKETTPENISAAIKTLARAGIRVTTLWIVGFPGETEEDFQETLDFIRAHHRHIYELDVHYYYYYPYGQVWSRRHQCYPLYPPDVIDAVKFQQWEIVDCDPPRHVKFSRLRRINELAAELGIPNLHTLEARYRAEERWLRAFPRAVEFLEQLQSPRRRATVHPRQADTPVSVDAGRDGGLVSYVVHTSEPLDTDALQRAAATLAELDGDAAAPLVVSIVSAACPGHHDHVLSSTDEADAARPALRVRVGDTGACLTLTAHESVADAQTVVMLFEDVFRLYEHIRIGRAPALRPRNARVAGHARPTSPAKTADADTSPRRASHRAQLALPDTVLRPLIARGESTLRPPVREALAAGIIRTLVGSDGGRVNCRVDVRSYRPELADTPGPLHETVTVAIPRRSGKGRTDIDTVTRCLRDAVLSRSAPTVDADIAVDLELLAPGPWLGDGAWRPHGFVVGPQPTDTTVCVRPTFEGNAVVITVDFPDTEASRVQAWLRAAEHGTDDWHELFDASPTEINPQPELAHWPDDWQ